MPVHIAESHRSRRVVASLERGADLLGAVAAICRQRAVRSGLLSAHGVLEEVELSVHDPRSPGRPASRRISSAATIVHLGGAVSERDGQLHVEASCALSREGESGVIVVGGQLRAARVVTVTLAIEAFEDLLLRTAADPVTGAATLTAAIEAPREATRSAGAATAPAGEPGPAPRLEPGPPRAEPSPAPRPAAPAPAPAPRPAAPAVPFEARATGHVVARPPAAAPAPTGTTWAEVAAASAQRGPVEEADLAGPSTGGGGDGEGDDDSVRAGDVIEHPRFGRCEVERLEGAGEYVQVRLRNRRLVRLSLDVLQLRRDGRDESGSRRFRARVST